MSEERKPWGEHIERVRLIVELHVRRESIQDDEPPVDLISKGVFLSWPDLRWWVQAHAVRDLDIDDEAKGARGE